MSTIIDVLKEATKDILSEETLKDIETVFNTSVNEKVELHVNKALTEQDADYASKLEKLVEAIDSDHTDKLKKVVEAIDTDRANKLKAVVEKYENALKNEASKFKGTLVNNISKYLELYLDEKLPVTAVNEAVKNKKAQNVLEGIRKTLAVDMAFSKDSIKEAVVEGKNRLDEAAKQLEASNAKATALEEELTKLKAELTLEQKVQGLDEERKTYVKKMFSGKSDKFIAENFDYAVGLYEKSEEEQVDSLKEEAVNDAVSAKVDRPVIAESVAKPVNEDPAFNNYLSELGKY
jgi:hypothetical protein